jgi:Fungal specific transcription factor domain
MHCPFRGRFCGLADWWKGVYYYQNDELILAWRKIGGAARMCLELGMHKHSGPPTDEIASRRAPWVSKMFWCIYVLDRRYSFMTNLPFTFRDEDIDPKLPLPVRIRLLSANTFQLLMNLKRTTRHLSCCLW